MVCNSTGIIGNFHMFKIYMTAEKVILHKIQIRKQLNNIILNIIGVQNPNVCRARML